MQLWLAVHRCHGTFFRYATLKNSLGTDSNLNAAWLKNLWCSAIYLQLFLYMVASKVIGRPIKHFRQDCCILKDCPLCSVCCIEYNYVIKRRDWLIIASTDW